MKTFLFILILTLVGCSGINTLSYDHIVICGNTAHIGGNYHGTDEEPQDLTIEEKDNATSIVEYLKALQK